MPCLFPPDKKYLEEKNEELKIHFYLVKQENWAKAAEAELQFRFGRKVAIWIGK